MCIRKKKQFINYIQLSPYVVLLLVAIFLTGCSFFPKEEPVLAPPLVEPSQVEYNTAKVKKGDLIKRVDGTGTFIAKESHDLSYSKDGGRLKELLVSEGDVVEQGQTLAEIDTGNLLFEIDQLQIELEKANLKLDQLKKQKADKYEIEIAKLDIEGIELRLYQLNKQYAESKIVSPINGVITFVSELKQGQTVPAYESVVQVAETSNLQLQYQAINQQRLNEVTVGMKVSITYNNETFSGEVVQTPNTVPLDVLETNPDQYSSSLLISLDSLPEDVEAGGMADIEIITNTSEDTLIIPVNGLRTSQGRNYVQISDGNTKREVDVEVGITSSTEVEIRSGLEEGDEIILK
ncbi:efflux RND transporter periplasmic adaptor subunit [Gracilibacillus sp. D59]|uniref:efflux RND transporter periplasmic adaptor subunit n=1 Tax=Gracilibacillus sp. D59 TaxID=3457434 RepID=UPI003FCD7951